MGGYLPDGCTQEDCDRAAGGYDAPYWCGFCEEPVDDEHECPGRDEAEDCTHGVSFSEECPQCNEEWEREEEDEL